MSQYFVFLLSQLPLPLILILNTMVWRESYKVKQASGKRIVRRPERLVVGRRLNLLSIPFAFLPPIIEGRIFVQDPMWLYSFAISAALSITGLLCMNSGLRQELAGLNAAKPTRKA